MISVKSKRAAYAVLVLWACGLAGCSRSEKPADGHTREVKEDKVRNERRDVPGVARGARISIESDEWNNSCPMAVLVSK